MHENGVFPAPTKAWWSPTQPSEKWWAVCADWELGLDPTGKGQSPSMAPFMAVAQGPYFFPTETLHLLSEVTIKCELSWFIYSSALERERKEVIKMRFYKIFCFLKSFHCVGKKEREKSLHSLCCLDSQTKRVACCKLRLSGSCCWQKVRNLRPTSNRPFWTEIYWGGGVTIFSTCQHFHNKSVLLCCGNLQIYCSQWVHEVSVLC